MGLTQHKNAVATIREVVNFLLLRGNIGRPGAGPCPVRGHSNVQGDRTMGIWEKMPDAFLDALRDEFGFEPPREHGCDMVDAIRAMRDGKVEVFFALGGNFVAATPDTDVTAAALRQLPADRARLDQAQPLPPAHRPRGADPALPGPHRARRAGGRRAVRHRRGLDGRGARLARAARARVGRSCAARWRSSPGSARQLFGDGPSTGRALGERLRSIREHIAQRRSRLRTTSTRGSRSPAASSCPAPPRDSRTFPTATGKAHFTVNAGRAPSRCPPGQLLLQTIRSHDQFNTTIYGLDDRYRGIHGGRRVVFVNADDLRELGLRRRRPGRPRQRLVRRRAARAGLPGRRVPDPARLRRRLLPRGERAGPAGLHRRDEQHPDVEVRGHPPRSSQRRLSSQNLHLERTRVTHVGHGFGLLRGVW